MGKKLTKEEFIAKVILKNEHVRNGDVEICGEFINTSERIECLCNIHNIIILWILHKHSILSEVLINSPQISTSPLRTCSFFSITFAINSSLVNFLPINNNHLYNKFIINHFHFSLRRCKNSFSSIVGMYSQ